MTFKNITIGIFLTIICLTLVYSDKEHVRHGAYSDKFKSEHDEHAHHEAIIGSKHEAEDFDEMPEHEAKEKLKVLAKRMDKNGDGIVSEAELIDWIHNSMIKLDQEEANERFIEIDSNKDNFVTWKEYAHEAFGTEDNVDMATVTDPDDKKLFDEDKAYFEAADLNKDGKISKEEFYAFQSPEHHDHMHHILIHNTLVEKDTNKDGRIDLKEYMQETHDNPNSEWYEVEKKRFEEEYDKNKDGFLDKDEIRKWLIPDIKDTARQEAQHLIENADKNKDMQLSYDEIVAAHKTFVGSEATNYGEILKEIHHEEL
uniref:Reticulocalbin-3 n=1 Tax=Parastrongyloides trichosuri TaxID=131310 RepID=A0A0N5A799_PARTI